MTKAEELKIIEELKKEDLSKLKISDICVKYDVAYVWARKVYHSLLKDK